MSYDCLNNTTYKKKIQIMINIFYLISPYKCNNKYSTVKQVNIEPQGAGEKVRYRSYTMY